MVNSSTINMKINSETDTKQMKDLNITNETIIFSPSI